ncbi:MAG: hypothetical protein ACQEVT_11540 [Pseudomonadota bacterium]|uniref:Tc toxin subunit A-related protein n=1 Tax=Roseovarius TaxID=74030 RepID=UPI00356953D7
MSPSLDGGYAHAEDADGNFADDPRFISGLGGIQAIATSHGQGDSGLHRLDFRDERYLPFEGAGTISRWHIQMDQRTNRFDLDTITDFIIHLDYTARSGGDVLRDSAMSEVVEASPKQGVVGLSAAQDFPAEWRRLLAPADAGQRLSVALDKRYLPWAYAEKEIAITSLTLVLNLKTSQDYEDYEAGAALSVDVTPPTGSAAVFLLEGDTSVNLRQTRIESFTPARSLGDWTFALSEDALASVSADLTISEEEGDVSHLRLDPDKIADMTLLIGFEVS